MSTPQDTRKEKAELSEHYRKILAKLLGRELPKSLTAEDQMSQDNLDMAAAFSSLVEDERFILLLAYYRKKGAEMAKKYHPVTSSDYELRWAAACRLIPENMAESVVDFIASVDQWKVERAKYLEKERKKADNPEVPPVPQQPSL